jgi:hypothetical protein
MHFPMTIARINSTARQPKNARMVVMLSSSMDEPRI